MTGRLTDSVLRSLRAEGKPLEFRDAGLPGFGVRVALSGHKSFTLV